jgi:TRAP-type C4-dicarboxylate transport system permease large subunit
MLPLLLKVGYPESKSIGLITSASSLGVLLAPSVPLIMYAIMARVPINTMFVAGLIPAALMVVSLLIFGGFLRTTQTSNQAAKFKLFDAAPSENAVPLKTAWPHPQRAQPSQ